MNPIQHVAIIMDGNGRWGIKNKNSRNLGHKAGLLAVEKIIQSSIKNKVQFLTLYAFSTENWKRPKKEINYLFSLLENSPNQRMIFTALPEVFVSNLKISLFASFLISAPMFIIQIILFISPALYKNEKKFFIPLITLSPFFFIAGILFAYYFLIPVIWNFFISYENWRKRIWP